MMTKFEKIDDYIQTTYKGGNWDHT
jgi:hypothetical protein